MLLKLSNSHDINKFQHLFKKIEYIFPILPKKNLEIKFITSISLGGTHLPCFVQDLTQWYGVYYSQMLSTQTWFKDYQGVFKVFKENTRVRTWSGTLITQMNQQAFH